MAMPWTISSSSCDSDAADILSAVPAATVESAAAARIFDLLSIRMVTEDVPLFCFSFLKKKNKSLVVGPLVSDKDSWALSVKDSWAVRAVNY